MWKEWTACLEASVKSVGGTMTENESKNGQREQREAAVGVDGEERKATEGVERNRKRYTPFIRFRTWSMPISRHSS